MGHRLFLSSLSLLMLSTLPSAFADPDDGAKVYKDVLKSIVWIHSDRGRGKLATGSGSLVDFDRRLVLTNYHVVGDNDSANVFFPRIERGKIVAEREYYIERLRRFGIHGKVVARDKKADLALIQLEGLPEGVVALKLAPESASPGQAVHSVGNPGDSGALWVYTPGKVRQVYHKKWKAKAGDETLSFEAEVVETDSATNPGDSGGPLVNEKGQLVGVTEGSSVGARLLSTFIDVSEVRILLDSRAVKGLPTPPKIVKPASRAVVVVDGAKLFSEEAIKKSTDQARELARKYDRDVLVETYAKVPVDQVDKVKEMSGAEKTKFFKKWAQDRMKAESVTGVYVLVCKDPTYLQVEVHNRSKVLFDEAFVKAIVNELLTQFKAKEFDAGLAGAVKIFGDKLATDLKP